MGYSYSSKTFNQAGCYTCRDCGRKAREVGTGNSDCELCGECYAAALIENDLADGHYKTPEAKTRAEAEMKALQAKAQELAKAATKAVK